MWSKPAERVNSLRSKFNFRVLRMFHCCKEYSLEKNTGTVNTVFNINIWHTLKLKMHSFLSYPQPPFAKC